MPAKKNVVPLRPSMRDRDHRKVRAFFDAVSGLAEESGLLCYAVVVVHDANNGRGPCLHSDATLSHRSTDTYTFESVSAQMTEDVRRTLDSLNQLDNEESDHD